MHDTQIYTKTNAGREAIRARTLGLSMPVRAILLMVDGHKTVAAMRSIIAGSKAPADTLDALASQGLIEPLHGPISIPESWKDARPCPTRDQTPPVTAASPETEWPPALPIPVAAMSATSLQAAGPRTAQLHRAVGVRSSRSSPLLQWSIASPSRPSSKRPSAATAHERLESTMNEIVRDFLPAHRRYFFQLKIERCTSPDELLELLHDLRNALAKSRGDAFASEVVARLRSAAV